VFQQISVNEMGPNSGVFIGNNKAPLWGSFSKQQTAMELTNGRAIRNRTFFSDRDVVDIIATGPFAVRNKRKKKKRPDTRLAGDVRSKRRSAKKRYKGTATR
jgi:hypothetical protein